MWLIKTPMSLVQVSLLEQVKKTEQQTSTGNPGLHGKWTEVVDCLIDY